MTSPAREQQLLESLPTELLINGEWRESLSGNRFNVHDPATGLPLTTVADASVADSGAALDAAAAAQREWAATSPRLRADILRRAFETVHARAEDFALLMTLEMGKSLAESRDEVTYGAEFFRWFSEEAVRVDGALHGPRPTGRPDPRAPSDLWAVPARHAVELPARHGHAQDRPGHGRRLRRRPEAGRPHPVDRAAAGRGPREAGRPGGGRERHPRRRGPARHRRRARGPDGCASCRSPAPPRWAELLEQAAARC